MFSQSLSFYRFLRPNLALSLMVTAGTLAAAAPLSVKLSPSDPALRCGATVTPVISWSGTPPKGTRSLEALVWDQQPNKLSGRWLVYDLPLTSSALPAVDANSKQVAGGKVAKNDAGKVAYSPLCDKGRHDIYVDFYAVNVASLNMSAGAPLRAVHTTIHKHNLLEARTHFVLVVK